MDKSLHKAARLAYLVLYQQKHGIKRTDTATLANELHVTQRSIQRDLHQVDAVAALLVKNYRIIEVE